MSRYLLDANILRHVMKPEPSGPLLAWMSGQRDQDLFITTLTIGEIWHGLLRMPAGRKHEQLKTWFNGPEGLLTLFEGRILPFDEVAAIEWARLMVDGSARGRPRNPVDMIVAAIAASNDCIVVSDNEKDFYGLEFINPLRQPPAG